MHINLAHVNSTIDAYALHGAVFGQGSSVIWLDDIYCRGFEDRLIECRHPPLGIHNCGHHQHVGVSCAPGKSLKYKAVWLLSINILVHSYTMRLTSIALDDTSEYIHH